MESTDILIAEVKLVIKVALQRSLDPLDPLGPTTK